VIYIEEGWKKKKRRGSVSERENCDGEEKELTLVSRADHSEEIFS